MTRVVRNFEVQGKKRQGFSIPFRPTIIGVVPLFWALNVVSLPTAIALFRGTSPYTMGIFSLNSIFYNIAFALLVCLFTLYILVVFRPKYVDELMKKYGYSLVGVEPGAGGRGFIKEISKVLAITAVFLIVVNFLPRLIHYFFRIPSQPLLVLICGVKLLIIIGVFADIVSQLEFYKDKQESGLREWSICYIAFDEIEAEVKKEYLKSKGIPALVKPFRYSWGLPIRTVVDQYQIYTPANNSQEARDLLLA
jgi:preprotein translocase subunit SecY